MNVIGNNHNDVNNSQAKSLLDAALRLVELGYPVFPLRPGSKEPLFAGGFHTATTDPEQIRKWWTKHPDANIGIAAPNLLVLDLDVDGFQEFVDHTKAELFGDFVPAELPAVRTASGGFHYYVRVEPNWAAEWGIGNNIRILPGIDLKGCGKGYVVAPGSVVGDNQYLLAGGWTELPPLDQLTMIPEQTKQAIEKAIAHNKKPRNNGAEPITPTTPRIENINEFLAELKAALAEIWLVGRRHALALHVAGILRKLGIPEDIAVATILDVAESCWDEEIAERERAVRDTFAKDISEIAGFSELTETEQAALKPVLDKYRPAGRNGTNKPTEHFDPNKTYDPSGSWRNRLKRISEIQSTNYPELEWLVEGVIPARGLVVLAGRPKSGKSWLALDLALSVAGGADCLGRPTGGKGTTIYLALEDTDARIKERSEIIGVSPDNAFIATSWAAADQGGYEELREMVRELRPKLVIVDTLSSFKAGSAVLRKPQFEIDYEQARKLKDIADEHNCCVLVVHHTRKADADDVFDTVSGTLGLNAVADTIAILQHQRGSESGRLHVTGRDVSDEQYTLIFERGRWIITDMIEREVDTTRDKVLRAVRQWGPAKARELRDILAREGVSYDALRQTLRRLVNDGVIVQDELGNYSYIRNNVTVSQCHSVTVSQFCDIVTCDTGRRKQSDWDGRHAERIYVALQQGPATISDLCERLLLESWQVRRGLNRLIEHEAVEADDDGNWWIAGLDEPRLRCLRALSEGRNTDVPNGVIRKLLADGYISEQGTALALTDEGYRALVAATSDALPYL